MTIRGRKVAQNIDTTQLIANFFIISNAGIWRLRNQTQSRSKGFKIHLKSIFVGLLQLFLDSSLHLKYKEKPFKFDA